MKKAVVFALLFGTAAVAAEARVYPKCNTYYRCTYTNYPDPIRNPGFSIFTDCVGANTDFIRGIEKYEVPYLTGWDNKKFTFAKPVDSYDPYSYLPMTTWEFTHNPYGPQCKRTEVMFNGQRIDFENCTDGHSRVCTTY